MKIGRNIDKHQNAMNNAYMFNWKNIYIYEKQHEFAPIHLC